MWICPAGEAGQYGRCTHSDGEESVQNHYKDEGRDWRITFDMAGVVYLYVITREL
jgi:hypothetical protein